MITKTAIYYHIGTVAKLTILKFMLKQIRNFAWLIKKLLRAGNQDSNWVRFAIATFLPLLTWYEKTLKFVSKDAFINTVMWGDEYKNSAKKGFYLTRLRHADEGYAILPYMKFLLFSSKCALSMLAAIFVYVYCDMFEKSPRQYDLTIMDTPIVPYLFTFVTCLFFTSVNIPEFLGEFLVDFPFFFTP